MCFLPFKVFRSVLSIGILFFAQAPSQSFQAFAQQSEEGVGQPQSFPLLFRSSPEPVILTNKESLVLSFCTPIEKKNCQIPNRVLHKTGVRQISDIQLSPEMPGTWRWETDYELRFTPKTPWPAGISYRVHLKKSLFPNFISFPSTEVKFSTAALTPKIELTFFQDPTETEKRGVFGTFSFNTPVEKKALRENLTFSLKKAKAGKAFHEGKTTSKGEILPFDLEMKPDGLQAQASIPLKNTFDETYFLTASFTSKLTASSGGAPLGELGALKAEESVEIPTRTNYMSFKKIEAKIIKNEHYIPKQVLILSSNIAISQNALKDSLEIYKLPKNKTSSLGIPYPNYAWESPSEVTNSVLSNASRVPFTVLPTALPSSTFQSITLDVDPESWIYVRLKKGLPGQGGYTLGQEHTDTVKIPAYKKEVKILSRGGLLALSGEKKVGIFSLGASKIRFLIQRVKTDSINHLASQTRGQFDRPYFLDSYSFSEDNISENFTEERDLAGDDERTPQFSVFDFSSYLKKLSNKERSPQGKGLFFLKVSVLKKNNEGQEEEISSDQRFILVSDLGFSVKKSANGGQDLFVMSVATGDAVPHAHVRVLGMNGLPIINIKTDSYGHAIIPNLQGFTQDRQPVVYVIQSQDDLAFMPMDREDRNLNYSQFDIWGWHESDDQLRAFIFSDRGLYRPGEVANLGMVIKQGHWSQDLGDLPLHLEITNPRGQIIDRPRVQLASYGLASYTLKTQDTWPTGMYSIRLYIGKGQTQIGQTDIRIEEFLPDTLKITSVFTEHVPEGWIHPDGLRVGVTLDHLYGAPAVDHPITGSVTVATGNFSFKKYPDYQFFDALKEKDVVFNEPLGTLNTSSKGQAFFDLNLSKFGRSTYEATFLAEGSAQDSGRSVRTTVAALVSPLSYVVGFKTDGPLEYINKNEKRTLTLLAVDSTLTPLSLKGMKAQIVEVIQIPSLVKNEEEEYEYRSVPKENPLSSSVIDLTPEGTAYTLKSEKGGDYILILSNDQGLVVQRIPYTIIGEGTPIDHSQKNANIRVQLDRQKYAPEDTLKIHIVAPYSGTGLITLETDHILAFKWFKASTSSSTQEIQIPKGFVGRGFVNVQFVRALDSTEIYTTPFAYNVKPFFVETTSLDSQIALTVPAEINSGETVHIGYTTKEKSKIIIYGVDEGILQYGHYVTPDPVTYFVGKRALQIQTSQIFDLLMPEYSIMQKLSSMGGDGVPSITLGNLNPFKRKNQPPVVFWSGILDADPTSRTVSYKVPEYFNGTIRFIAVSVSENRMGASETKAFSYNPVIISPNMTSFAAPGDEFTIGVGLANKIRHSGPDTAFKIKVSSSSNVEILEGGDASLTIPENQEIHTQVRVRTKKPLGEGRLTFQVTRAEGDLKVSHEETLSIRPPLPRMTTLMTGYIPQEEKSLTLERKIYPDFGKIEASVSTLPLAFIPGLMLYLNQFPFGCTEQLISRAFPALILAGQKDFAMTEAMVNDSVKTTMSHLRESQLSSGGLEVWSGSSGMTDDFITIYAFHYLLLAREKQLPIDEEVFRQVESYIKKLVAKNSNSLEEARIRAYGIYLLTRSGIVTSNYIPTLLDVLDQNYKSIWRHDLTAVYLAGAYKLMQLIPQSEQLISGVPMLSKETEQTTSLNDYYSPLIRDAVYLSMIADHFPERLEQLDRQLLFRMADFLGQGYYNTLSAAYVILAFNSYGKISGEKTNSDLFIRQKNSENKWQSLTLTGDLIKKTELHLEEKSVQIGGGKPYGIYYQIATDGYDQDPYHNPLENGLEIARHYRNGNGQEAKTVAVGEVIEVELTMRAHGDRELTNIALVDLLPGGFEVIPESLPAPKAKKEDESSDEEDLSEENKNTNSQNDADSNTWKPNVLDVREDRVIAVGSLPPEAMTYRYKIKAINRGTFATPPAFASSLYDVTKKAHGVSGKITVK